MDPASPPGSCRQGRYSSIDSLELKPRLTVNWLLSYTDAGSRPSQKEAFMSNGKRPLSSKLTGAAVTRRQFMKLAGVSVASAGVLSWPHPLVFAAQPARKRIIIHGERQATSLGYHNRSETEHMTRVESGKTGI